MPAPKPFPSREEWQAPWEKNGTEFDAETAATLVYNLEKRVHERLGLPDRVRELETELEAKNTELEQRTTRVRELEDAAATDEAEKVRLEQQRFQEEMRAGLRALAEGKPLPGTEVKGAQQQDSTEQTVSDTDRELALLRAGVPADEVAAHVKRVSGTNMEELTEDAKAYAATLGYGASDESGGDTRYDAGSGSREMPSDVPRRGGHRTDLGGNLPGLRVNPADVRDLIPR